MIYELIWLILTISLLIKIKDNDILSINKINNIIIVNKNKEININFVDKLNISLDAKEVT